MLKAAYAVTVAAFVTMAFVATLEISAQVQARGSIQGAKADRADTRPLGAKCSHHAWPYYEAACLYDASRPFGEARAVRVVTTDRISLVASAQQ